MVPQSASLLDTLKNKELGRMIQMIDPDLGFNSQGLLKGERFLEFLYDQLAVKTFEEMPIPFKCVATDFWNYESVIFDSGDLGLAVRASMAIPYVFSPVNHDGRILVDGGLTNNVPMDLLDEDCDLRIAINIRGERSTPKDKIPNMLESIFHSYEVMQESTTKTKLDAFPVDIYCHPPIKDIYVMDFYRAEEIYKQGLQIKDEFKAQLEQLLDQ
jgi:NTE family protein